jgi:hypothetical protein
MVVNRPAVSEFAKQTDVIALPQIGHPKMRLVDAVNELSGGRNTGPKAHE